MQYIIEFKKALEKKQSSNKISCVFDTGNFDIGEGFKILLDRAVPKSIVGIFSIFNGLTIYEPRHFKLLKFSEIYVLDERYLVFAIMNTEEKICFDMDSVNSAGEWDIVCYGSGFVITKTLASYLANKVWAWIDRARTIWKEEAYV